MNAYTYKLSVKSDFHSENVKVSRFAEALSPNHVEFQNLQYPTKLNIKKPGQASLKCSVATLGFSFFVMELPNQGNNLENIEGTLKVYYHDTPSLPGASVEVHRANMAKALSTVLSVLEDTFEVTRTEEEVV